MNANERDEIAASVAAHAELGPRYDTAVAEGLVERIGEEIDRRIDTRLGGRPLPGQGRQDGGLAAPPYPGPPASYGPAAQAPSAPGAVPPPPAAPRRAGGLSGVVLGLGSMGLGVGATSVVVSHHVQSFAALLMILLIWGAIAAINTAHAQRRG